MHRLSATQITQVRECPRKIAWRFVKKIKVEKSKALQLGINIHQALETYLKTGQLDYVSFPDARFLEPALHFLPAPGDCIAEGRRDDGAQHTFSWMGFEFVYQIDALQPKTKFQPGVIYDLKTTSNKKYAKTQTELRAMAQPIIYFAAEKHRVDACRWVYTLTKGKKEAWPVDFVPVTSGPLVDQIFDEGTLIAKIVKDQIDPLALPPAEPEICDMYDGCEYRPYCKDLSPLRHGKGNGEDLMSAKDLVKRLQQSTTTEEEAPINPPEVAQAGPPPLPDPPKAAKPAKPKKPAGSSVAGNEQPAPAEARTEVGQGPGSPLPAQTNQKAIIKVLWIDCMPGDHRAQDVIDAASILSLAHDDLKKEVGVNDFQEIDYKGGGYLSALFFARLDAEFGQRDDLEIYADTQGRMIRNVIEELRARAVYKNVRR